MSDSCGKLPGGGWHCAGTGCLNGVCMHDAATPTIVDAQVIPENMITTNPGDAVSRYRLALERAGYG